MKSHFRFGAIAVGLLVSALASYRLWQLWNLPADAWWTPAHLAMPLEAANDRLEVMVGNGPLAKAIEAKKVAIIKDGVEAPAAVADFAVRVNDYDRQRVMRLPTMLSLAALAGGGFVLFAIGLFTPLIGAFRQRGLVDLHLTT